MKPQSTGPVQGPVGTTAFRSTAGGIGSVGHMDGVPLPLDAADPDELELVDPVAMQPVVDEVLELPTVHAAREAPKARRLAQNK